MELIEVKKGKVICCSQMVAKKYGMEHHQVTRIIKKLIGDLLKYKDRLIQVANLPYYYTEERDYRGTKYTAYLMGKRFFMMLAQRFRGEEAMVWQWTFINAFDAMEKRIILADQNTKDTLWLTQRKQGKIVRREETDVIKEFVDYATSQGSKNAKFYYKHITSCTYKSLKLMEQKKPKLRDSLDVLETASLVLSEDVVAIKLKKYMALGRNYKDIYESVKDDMLKFGSCLRIE